MLYVDFDNRPILNFKKYDLKNELLFSPQVNEAR